jgi:Biopolymer transport protein
MDRIEMMEGLENNRLIADINVIPFIDIVLVLLIIFMITAPLMLGGVHVNLPKIGGEPMPRPENPAIVSLDAENRVYLDKEELALEGRHERFKQLARESATGEVFVRGDGEVKYGKMMELMAALGSAGFARVTLVTDIRVKHNASQPDADQPGTSTDILPVPASGGAKTAMATNL